MYRVNKDNSGHKHYIHIMYKKMFFKFPKAPSIDNFINTKFWCLHQNPPPTLYSYNVQKIFFYHHMTSQLKSFTPLHSLS